jgi:hypothetical protein
MPRLCSRMEWRIPNCVRRYRFPTAIAPRAANAVRIFVRLFGKDNTAILLIAADEYAPEIG